MTDGGRIVPDEFADELFAYATRPLHPAFRPTWELRPLTWRQRMRGRWYQFKWAVHDRMFGRHEDHDE